MLYYTKTILNAFQMLINFDLLKDSLEFKTHIAELYIQSWSKVISCCE